MRLLLGLVLAAASTAHAETRLYVATDGDDAGAGTEASPFGTLHRARDAARAVDDEVRISVGEGTHYLSEPLVLGPEDSNTVWEAREGENVVLSGGRPVEGWERDGDVWAADVDASDWVFRQLFVDGRRAIRARYPNFDESDVVTKGWLRARQPEGYGIILAGIAKQGDFLEYELDVPADGAYDLWASYATISDGARRGVRMLIDGEEITLPDMPASGSWRKTVWCETPAVELTEGEHRLRIEGALPTELRVHFDAFVFTDDALAEPDGHEFPRAAAGQNQVAIQAEDEVLRLDGATEIEVGLRTFACDGIAGRESRTQIEVDWGEIRDSWKTAPSAEVNIFATWGWFNERARIVGVDEQESTLEIEGRELQYPIRAGNRYHVENVREELDAPGEWYLDAAAGRLYYMPIDRPPTESTVVAPAMDRIVHILADIEGDERVEGIAFRGFTFSHSDWTLDHASVRTAEDAAVWLENAWNCAVEDCTFTLIGGTGVRLHLDSRSNRIAGNTVTDAGGNGVLLTSAVTDRAIPRDRREAAQNVAPVENVIERNHVHHCGKITKYVAGIHIDSRPASMAQSVGNIVSHNSIHDMPRNGIFAFNHQGGNTFEANRIERIMLESDDGGGIHICQDTTDCAPTVIRGNVISDVHGIRAHPDGTVARHLGLGIYLDCVTSHCLVERNVVWNTSNGNVFLHGGSHNTVTNNILAGDAVRLFWISNYTEGVAGNRFVNNIVYSPEPLGESFGLTRFTPETLIECDGNAYWNGGDAPKFSPYGGLGEWRDAGYDTASLVEEPPFRDADAGDFSLGAWPLATDLGFEIFDAGDAGM